MRWAFLVDGMGFDADSLTSEKSLGGSETAGLCLSREVAKLGHEVFLFCRCDREGTFNGVVFRRVERFIEWAQEVGHDVTVVQRVPAAFSAELASPVHILWCHDLAMKRNEGMFRGTLWNVNSVALLSKFMKAQYQEVYNLPEEAVFLTRNGIDLSLIESAPPPPERDMRALVYTARPERGVDILLGETFPRLLREEPGIHLYIAGYDNYVEHLQPLYEHMRALIQGFSGRVRHVGALNKQNLYRLYKTCALYVYPTDFEEISCITAMECMACGLPMVASAHAAIPETLNPEAGALIPHDEKNGGARNKEYQETFVESCLTLLRTRDAWEKASRAGIKSAESLGWDGVARQWDAHVEGLLNGRD